MKGDTRPVRATEQLNWDALATYLRLQLPDRAITGLDLSREMEVTQVTGGPGAIGKKLEEVLEGVELVRAIEKDRRQMLGLE